MRLREMKHSGNHKDPIKININGKTYDSINAAARALGLAPTTIRDMHKKLTKSSFSEVTVKVNIPKEFVLKKVKNG